MGIPDSLFVIGFLGSILTLFSIMFYISNKNSYRQNFHNHRVNIHNHISDDVFCIVYKAK